MSDEASQVDRVEPQPFFADIDVPCPECGYNLRGLIEPRCPECGNRFDPYKVLYDYREMRPALPILWVLWNMYRHPVSFWQLHEVRLSRGPRRLQIFCWLLLMPVAAVGAAIVGGYLYLWARVGGFIIGWQEVLIVSISLPAIVLVISFFLYFFAVLHGALCRVALLRSTAREGARAAKEVVGYGLVWFSPILAAVVVTFVANLWAPASIAWGVAVEAGCALIMVLSALAAWATTLYAGGKFVSGGSRRAGVVCAVTNPFWYILGLIVVAALYG